MKKNKKLALILMLLALAFALCACAGGGEKAASTENKTTAEIPTVLNQGEYVLYQNIFYNDYGVRYEGTETEKQGVFTVVQDAYTNVKRYYVWGYLDNTKCCDWQWEFVPGNAKNLPAPGSLVKVKGTFTASEDALDGYWITGASVETLQQYTGDSAEVNMLAMSDTLERVQITNINNRSQSFEGKSFIAYGRVANAATLQDPYYDGSWNIPFTTHEAVPAIGTTILLKGVVQSGVLANCSVTSLD